MCLNSLKRAGNSPLTCSQNSKTFEGTVIVGCHTSFKYLGSCAIGVTFDSFDVSWFPSCLLLAYVVKNLGNSETFEPSADFSTNKTVILQKNSFFMIIDKFLKSAESQKT